MKESTRRKLIPGIFDAIRTADIWEISHYENIMVSKYATSLLHAAAVANFVVRYFSLSQGLLKSLWDSLAFILLGLAYHYVVKMGLDDRRISRIIAILSFITLLYYTIRFYPLLGPAIWIAVFIQLILAMILITKEMYLGVGAAALLANIFTLLQMHRGGYYDMPLVYYIVHSVLFALMLIVAAGVHKVNIDRYHNLEEEYQDLMEKKDEIIALNEEITASHEETKYLAYHDNLTGLPNRLLLYEQTDHAITLAKRSDTMIAVMFLDLDGFKNINDTLGHTMGDRLLVDVSRRLKHTVRESDVVARIGGDEFIIMIEGIEEADTIHYMAEKILDSFSKPFVLHHQEWFVSTSIGIAVYPSDGINAVDLVKNADIAMYKSKENGKNQYVLCSPLIKDIVLETMQLNNDLYHALEGGELELFYQPQINSASGQIVGMEALIRWNHPKFGLVSPAKFIPIAEQSGLILPIGEWVLKTACAQNKAWQDAGYPAVRMAVNISIKQLESPRFGKQVEEVLRDTGLDPRYLGIEITEGCALKSSDDISHTLKALKETGIQIAIDDFGIAFSALSYLKTVPTDIIKIDQTFIQGIEKNKADKAITRSIITLAKAMGIHVIAEGVETMNQRDFLVQEMCDELQGFYFAKPMPLSTMEKVWKEQIR
mgnify:CR=1 FL=1